ncbi:MAG TPA: type I polyketide synthase, partial [Polyangiaceae bacterium]|nr:type I polyketide synthase [Polyangiaceae bacterium]
SGLTVPNGPSQQDVIRLALRRAGLSPREVSYVEAHGTGTPLGDPIEMQSIEAVLAKEREGAAPLLVGSAKTNLGHLEAAAGVAGVIKVALSLRHGAIPAHLQFATLNPHISLAQGAIEIPNVLREWPRGAGPRVAGVSSFGISGTNAHVLLQEAPEPEPVADQAPPRLHLLTLSARSSAALEASAKQFADCLAGAAEERLTDICYTASVRRSHLEQRLTVTGAGRDALLQGLRRFLDGERRDWPRLWTEEVLPGRGRPLVFVFSGVGSHWPRMGMRLFEDQPAYRQAFSEVDALVRARAGWSVLEYVRASDDASLLDDPEFGEPCIFAVQVGLARLYEAFGVRPDAVVGHSLGEVAAAHVAGALSLEQAVDLVLLRSRLRAETRGALGMALVHLPHHAPELSEDGLCVAAVNAPNSVVVSGTDAAIGKLEQKLRARNVFIRRVKSSVASHSPFMDGIRSRLEAGLAGLTANATTYRFYSSVTAEQQTGAELAAEYWGRNLRDVVRFADVIERIVQDGHDLFIELSPHATLVQSIEEIAVQRQFRLDVLRSLDRRSDDGAAWLGTLGALHALGHEVELRSLFPPGARLYPVPGVVWQRKRFWVNPPAVAARPNTPPVDAVAPLLYTLRWVTSERPALERARAGHWLIFEADSGLGEELGRRLEAQGHRSTRVRFGNAWQACADGSYRIDPDSEEHYARLIAQALAGHLALAGIVFTVAYDAEGASSTTLHDLKARLEPVLLGALRLSQSMTRTGGGAPLWLVTRGGAVAARASVDLAQAPLWGLGRVIALENPHAWGGVIDLEPCADPESAGRDAETILGEILAPDGEDHVAYSEGQRRIARLERAPCPELGVEAFTVSPDACYLVTGGLGALGLQVAEWLYGRGARRLVLLGRQGLLDESRLAELPDEHPQHQARAAVRRLEAAGVAVTTFAADVADAARMREVFRELEGQNLRGVIHAAGISIPRTLLEMDRATFDAVLRAKVDGAWLLHELTRDLDLDFFVLFSSLASVLGSAMLGPYAAANHFLDALAHERNRAGLPATCINWGGWAGEGMTTAEAQSYFEQMGLGVIEAATAFSALARLTAAGAVQTTVAEIDWERYKPVFEARRRRPLLELVGPRDGNQNGQHGEQRK